MENIALSLSYEGTRYHGWQTQKNASSLQQTITEALEKLLGQEIYLSGCGRTDAGVHARRYLANFKADCPIPLNKLPLALNAHLPMDISIKGAVAVPEEFDARFSCTKKEYTYYIYPCRIRDPFLTGRTHAYPYPLDVEKMAQGAAHFAGSRDFASMQSVGTPVKSTVRTVHYVSVRQEGELIAISACADGFLYNMVRAIAGTLLYVGCGKFSPDHVAEILASADRKNAGPTLPGCGLFMTRLWYADYPQITPLGLERPLTLPLL